MYENLVEWRSFGVDDVEKLLWVKADGGAWEGPKADWPHLKAKIEQYCTNRRIAIQAGGCMGMYPRLLSNMFSRVFTFEPDALNFHCLVNNCQMDKIVKFNAALGLGDNSVSLDTSNTTNRGMFTINKDNGNIPVMKLDDLTLNDGVDLLQLDVEGFEQYVILGGVQLISDHKPVIIAENGHNKYMEDLLSSYDYKLVDRCNADSVYIPG